MREIIGDPTTQTWIFAALLAAVIAASATRRAPGEGAFPRSTTENLKGLAILLVLFAHIGYALVPGGRFLFPLSVGGGVGVNIFLALAGYGLAASALAAPRSARDFYRRHLPKLYAPMGASLAVFVAADRYLFGVSRDPGYVARAAAGYFPTADLYADVNSPLWYFTFIVGAYLLFPVFFSRARPWATAAAYAATGAALAAWRPAPLAGVIDLYADHYLAFPVGVIAAWALAARPSLPRLILAARGSRAAGLFATALALAAAWGSIYAAGIGTWREQLTSLALAALIVAAFAVAPARSRVFGLFGAISYELYLLHWPILSRWPSPYVTLPGWAATAVALAALAGVAALFRAAVRRAAS